MDSAVIVQIKDGGIAFRRQPPDTSSTPESQRCCSIVSLLAMVVGKKKKKKTRSRFGQFTSTTLIILIATAYTVEPADRICFECKAVLYQYSTI